MAAPVVGYVRVSRVAGREGDSFQSPARQEQDVRAYCKQHGLRLAEVVTELDESGAKLDRSKLQAIVEGIQEGRYGGVVVANIDRLTRLAARDRVKLFDAIEDAGGIIRSAAQELDTSTPAGRFTRELFLSLARMDWEQKAEQFERTKATAIARGVHITGTVPVGYVRTKRGTPIEVDPVKAPVIREAFELRASGVGLGAVCAFLEGKLPGGVRGDRMWRKGTLDRLLRCRTYLGEARQGKHVLPGAHEAIVDERTFDVVQAMFRRREPDARPNAKSLLAGLVRCGSCGYAMARATTGGKHGGKYRYSIYNCRNGEHPCDARATCMQPKLDELVLAAVAERLQEGAAGRGALRVVADADVDGLHQRLALARSQRAPFEDPAYVSALGVEAALRALAQVDEEIAAIEDEIAAATTSTSTRELPEFGELADTFLDLTTDEQREVMQAMIEGVMVSRAPRRVALVDRVEIVWHGEGTVARPSRGRPRKAVVEAGVAAA